MGDEPLNGKSQAPLPSEKPPPPALKSVPNLFSNLSKSNPLKGLDEALKELEGAEKEATATIMRLLAENPAAAALVKDKTGADMTEDKVRKIVKTAIGASIGTVIKLPTFDESTAYDKLVTAIHAQLTEQRKVIGLEDDNLCWAFAENAAHQIILKKKNPYWHPRPEQMTHTKILAKELVSRLLNEHLDEMSEEKRNRMLDFAGEINGDGDRAEPRAAFRKKLAESVSESIAPLVADPRFREQPGGVQRGQLRDAISEGIHDRRVIADGRTIALISDVVAFTVAQRLNKEEVLPPVARSLYMTVMPEFVTKLVNEEVQKAKKDAFFKKAVVSYDELRKPIADALIKIIDNPYFHALKDQDKKKDYVSGIITSAIKRSGSNVLGANFIASEVAEGALPALNNLPPEMKSDPAKQADAIYQRLSTSITKRQDFIAELTTLASLDNNERRLYLETQPKSRIIKKMEQISDLAKIHGVDLRPFDMAAGADAKKTSELVLVMKRLRAEEVYEPVANRNARTANLIQPTGLTRLTGSPDDLKAAANYLGDLSIFFTLEDDKIIVSSGTKDSFRANIPLASARVTSAELIAKQKKEAEQPMQEKLARDKQEKAEEIAYLEDLERRSRMFGDYLRQQRNPGGVGMAQVPPLPADLFHQGDIMFMQRCPEKLPKEFYSAYALAQSIWHQQEQERNPHSPLFNPQLAAAPTMPLPTYALPLFSQLPNHADINHDIIMERYGSEARYALGLPSHGHHSPGAYYAIGSGGMSNQRPGYTPPGSVPRGNGSSVGPSQ